MHGPCCLGVGTATQGYVRKWNGRRFVMCHRTAWEEASGEPIPDGMLVCHVCDNPACIRADDHGVYVIDGVEYERRGHLWLGTQWANMRDRALKGRANLPRGERHWTRR